ncbi:hypothetical protein PFF91_28830 [Burkholderia cenocepacia]|uniref:hypothetical protein n=1 Tax=Burkholderia cenocepacia TaxID=95486 RepID=UPI0022EA541B|nr:hypothetical protein [Burkholderia cenocepacia]MDA3670007.1 hypothetical protein [Burkholderia cenocepacia]MDA3679739.1 hypothetical protein [Burkholderia cenocepacia]MDA3687576.1 hypothetical protein [Burkholderia cenocepacia]MDA3695021.1 hypothetical protein [Burkholderia cenocepacia]MDA3701924.1 hypothetical protein [Burkholderia cenocepacia]
MTERINEKQVLDRKVQEWTKELKRLANQLAAAKGVPSAIVMITPRDEEYADVVPELIAEDALRVHRDGWPEAFEVEILNQLG